MGKWVTKAAALITATTLALPANAAIFGWFDVIYVGMFDTATGWICDTADPNSVPQGSLVIYRNGTYYGEQAVSSAWGGYRPDVPAAGYCGSNSYTGWSLSGWFTGTGVAIDVYYRHPDNSLQLIGGSGKVCNGPGICY